MDESHFPFTRLENLELRLNSNQLTKLPAFSINTISKNNRSNFFLIKIYLTKLPVFSIDNNNNNNIKVIKKMLLGFSKNKN